MSAVSSPHTNAPCAHADIDSEIEVAVQDAAAEQAFALRLPDCFLQPLCRQRIFTAHIDKSLVGAHRETRYGHSFQYPVGIGFHQRAVHVSTGVALVAVCNYILALTGRLAYHVPFEAGGETRAAASAKAAFDHRGANLLRVHFPQGLSYRGVAASSYIALDLLRVQRAAFGKDQFLLFGKKGPVARELCWHRVRGPMHL